MSVFFIQVPILDLSFTTHVIYVLMTEGERERETGNGADERSNSGEGEE